jgi:hypothetical protein
MTLTDIPGAISPNPLHDMRNAPGFKDADDGDAA